MYLYTFIYAIYFSLKRTEKTLLEKGLGQDSARAKLVRFVIGYIEAYYNLYIAKQFQKHPSHRLGVTAKKREQKIIVSLTSYPKRIGTVWITIETLLRQTMKPDEIILWLADTQFEGLESLPEELIRQQERGLTIRFCDDLKSHKKYFYTMQEYPNDLVILVDDDAFYPLDTVELLMKYHENYPEDIICMTPAKISDISAMPSQWGRFEHNEKIIHSKLAQPFTGQGTLYTPVALDRLYLFQKKLVMSICPYADDLWLEYMALRNGTMVTSIHKNRSMPVPIYGTGESSLWFINGEGEQNDVQWKNILDFFSER